ncbi:MAG: hypothetical protein VXZ53_25850, partial [Planctomycetota bacterium]|nr:hypothetical protein [Planctomycetota bacterium]
MANTQHLKFTQSTHINLPPLPKQAGELDGFLKRTEAEVVASVALDGDAARRWIRQVTKQGRLISELTESTAFLPSHEPNVHQFIRIGNLLRAAIYKGLGNSTDPTPLACEISRRETEHERVYDAPLRGRQLLWTIAYFFGMDENQQSFDQEVLATVKWQGDENVHKFLSKWYATLGRLREAPSEAFLREAFFNQCRKSSNLLKNTFEDIDLSPRDSPMRTYGWLLNRLEALLRIRQEQRNRSQVAAAISGSAPGIGAPGVEARGKPKGGKRDGGKGAPPTEPKGKGKSTEGQVCFHFLANLCKTTPCPNGREHRKA